MRTLHCPCCNQPWDVGAGDPLPLFMVRPLAFKFVKRELGLSEAALRGGRRHAELVKARALIVWIARSFGPPDASFPRIGRWLGKDHSSIHHLWHEAVPRLQRYDPEFPVLCSRFADFALEALKQQETPDGDTRH